MYVFIQCLPLLSSRSTAMSCHSTTTKNRLHLLSFGKREKETDKELESVFVHRVEETSKKIWCMKWSSEKVLLKLKKCCNCFWRCSHSFSLTFFSIHSMRAASVAEHKNIETTHSVSLKFPSLLYSKTTVGYREKHFCTALIIFISIAIHLIRFLLHVYRWNRENY